MRGIKVSGSGSDCGFGARKDFEKIISSVLERELQAVVFSSSSSSSSSFIKDIFSIASRCFDPLSLNLSRALSVLLPKLLLFVSRSEFFLFDV